MQEKQINEVINQQTQQQSQQQQALSLENAITLQVIPLMKQALMSINPQNPATIVAATNQIGSLIDDPEAVSVYREVWWRLIAQRISGVFVSASINAEKIMADFKKWLEENPNATDRDTLFKLIDLILN